MAGHRNIIGLNMELRYSKIINEERVADRKGFRLVCKCGVIYTRTRSETKINALCIPCGNALRRTTHGMKGTPIYSTWKAMNQRCRDANSSSYKYYGERGIKICKRWEKFENFYADMGERYEGMTLDRIDTNGDYCPENCRWATRKQQMRNMRRNRIIRYKDKDYCLSELAEEFEVSISTLWCRLEKGFSIEDALTTPVKHRRSA